ncbi:Spx/MgsR family RNA polymerase-binding regulatory protein [Lunatimonas salinarum]|uniref:Spx/MgsR family RNA polymerase-binding regulatory protein n=1 Tax=Lunatimonas salinarum TaxID=1774590 RepID=UPI001ADFD363|nr:Spx/MgsR family RNA polymerase-binding regulatory protein [Lunatimonas salinarum]
MSTKIFGIKNCNIMKKTFEFFETNGMSYQFIDYKKQAPSLDLLSGFLSKISLDDLVNRRGTTYKKLSEEDKAKTQQPETALVLLSEKSSMIKRPIIEFEDGDLLIGFDEEAILAKK